MNLNTQNSTTLMATFFANEFLISIMVKTEPILKQYRENIDNYCNSTTAFMMQKNPAYEILLDKMVSFYKKYINTTREEIIRLTCSEVCSKYYLSKMNDRDRIALFRKFITVCIKSFAARALVLSKEYVSALTSSTSSSSFSQSEKEKSEKEKEKSEKEKEKSEKGKGKSGQEKSTLFRKNMVQSYEIIITENKNQLFAEFSYLEKGKDPASVSVINSENKLLEELRQQNEELRFDNMQLKEQLLKIANKLETIPTAPVIAKEEIKEEIKEETEEDYDEFFETE